MLKLKSSTLIEIIVALVLLSIFTLLFFRFIQKSQRDINVEQKIKALYCMNSVIATTLNDSTFINTDYKFENIVVQKKIVRQDGSLILINFSAFSLISKKLVERNIYVISKRDNQLLHRETPHMNVTPNLNIPTAK